MSGPKRPRDVDVELRLQQVRENGKMIGELITRVERVEQLLAESRDRHMAQVREAVLAIIEERDRHLVEALARLSKLIEALECRGGGAAAGGGSCPF